MHNKMLFMYMILTGVALGAYSLAWIGAIFFSFVIGVYITIQYIQNHMHGKSNDYVAITGVVVFYCCAYNGFSNPVCRKHKVTNSKRFSSRNSCVSNFKFTLYCNE